MIKLATIFFLIVSVVMAIIYVTNPVWFVLWALMTVWFSYLLKIQEV